MEGKYFEICKNIEKNVGGKSNIIGVAHCATRLRIVLKDNSLAKMDELEEIDKVKGAFVAGNQIQLIFGAGLVNDVYDEFAQYTGIKDMSLGELKQESAKKGNLFQTVIKALSDVFIGIMPAILSAALLMGITGVLGNLDVVNKNDTLYAINKLANIASVGIFAILPMAICYSAVKRFGGNPVLGMVVGAIMLDGSLANAYAAAQGTVTPEILHLFGMNVELVGFQGGIIIALMMGYIVARMDIFFSKKIPDAVKLLVAPLLTVFISTLLLFTVVGPVGRAMSNGITNALVWMTNNLGAAGYACFAGLQQLVVITGLHHIIGAVEVQLIASTGTNFLNPLMSVALMGQGGAVLGYLALHWKNVKTRELCIPSFCSTLFGISEPAIFGVNLRYRYPLIGGCIGGAFAGAYVYFTKLTALGFGTTALPGIAIACPENNGYLNYVIAHLIAFVIGGAMTILIGMIKKDQETAPAKGSIVKVESIPKTETVEKEETEEAKETEETKEAVQTTEKAVVFRVPVNGVVLPVTESSDPTFAQKMLGDGITVRPSDGVVKAPCSGKIVFVYPSGHAVGLETEDGTSVLIHCGINTVELNGEGFSVKVQAGDQVTEGQELLTFDKDLIEKKGYSAEVIMIVPELKEGKTVTMENLEQYGANAAFAVV